MPVQSLFDTFATGGKSVKPPRSSVIYDIGANLWYPSGSLCTDRSQGTATASPNGAFALFAGGEGFNKTKFSTVDRFEATPGVKPGQWACIQNLSQVCACASNIPYTHTH
jgi:hypothetical protein